MNFLENKTNSLQYVCVLLFVMMCNITLADSNNYSATRTNPCRGKSLAVLLDSLMHVDSLHNCSLNIVRTENDEVLQYLIEIQDDYFCERDPSKCHFELLEFKIDSYCLDTPLHKVENIFYQEHFKFPEHLVSKFFRAEFDFYSQLIFLSIGERSLIPEKNHRISCKPMLFGGSH